MPHVSPIAQIVAIHPSFESFLLYAIGANTIVMCLNYYGMEEDNPSLYAFVTYSELFFSFLFTLECFLKILGLGFGVRPLPS